MGGLANKIKKISVLIEEYSKEYLVSYSSCFSSGMTHNSMLPVIEELQEWLSLARNTADEANSQLQLATILIKNYLRPSQNAASLLIKLSLPTVFNKNELERMLKGDILSISERERFKETYLKNTLEIKPQSNLISASNFFSKQSPKDINRMILAKNSSLDLVRMITTNRLFYSNIAEILFDRQDDVALRFQVTTLASWFKQISNGDQTLGQLFHSKEVVNQWIRRIKNCLMGRESVLTYKVHCIKLLQYLFDESSVKINKRLTETIAKIRELPAPQFQDVDRWNTFLKDDFEYKRTIFLEAMTPGAKSTEIIDSILDAIELDDYDSTEFQQANYSSLGLMASSLGEQQLIRAVTLCFKKAIKAYCHVPNCAEKALFDIMNQTLNIPIGLIQTFFIETINEVTGAGSQKKDYADSLSFRVLSELSKDRNPEIFNLFTNIIISRINHADVFVRRSVYDWVCLLAFQLTEIREDLVSGVIKAIITDQSYSYEYDHALKSVANKLSIIQLTKYIHQYLPWLGKESREEKIQGCRIIGALASSLSPCPEDIVLQLITLTKNNERGVSRAAFDSLKSLKPTSLLIKSGIISDFLSNDAYGENQDFVFKCIIALESSISSQDITDDLIKKLIHSRVNYDQYKLENRALSVLSNKFNEQQLTTYIEHCLQWNTFPVARQLNAIPTHLLTGRLDALFTKYQALLNDENWHIRSKACLALVHFKPILPLFPDDFLINFVHMLTDGNYVVSSCVCEALPEILHLVQRKHVDEVCELLLSNASRSDHGMGSDTIRQTTSTCLSLLAPRLNQEKIIKVKHQLIVSLDDHNFKTRIDAFISLIKITHRFSNEELTALIIILAGKADQYTYRYIPTIAHLITEETQGFVIKSLFGALDSDSCETRCEACLALSSIAPYVSADLVEQIIFKFIVIITNEGNEQPENIIPGGGVNNNQDSNAALNGLIGLADFITASDLKQISNLPQRSIGLIVAQYVLETYFDLHQTKLSPKFSAVLG